MISEDLSFSSQLMEKLYLGISNSIRVISKDITRATVWGNLRFLIG